MNVPRLDDRACGVLLHPTSLPDGELGGGAHDFADFLAEAGQSWWQMLPVGPTGYGNSPYSALSAFAGNPALVSVQRLVEEGLLPDGTVAAGDRETLIRAAFAAFFKRPADCRADHQAFCELNADWLDDFALYRALKRQHGEVQWTKWVPELRDREPGAMEAARKSLKDEIAYYQFEQFRFDSDWQALRAHCARLGIGLIGDVPIFVAHDSADVWQHRDLFYLDADGEPTLIAGVPPDYFSETGQRWGNPLYRWKRMARTEYGWWIDRLRATLARFDAVRLDHFIGFERYWEIPATEPTAVGGRWVQGPGTKFFKAVAKGLGTKDLPLIAEDLGVVTPAVEALRRKFDLPGIRVLQFAFGTDPQAPSFLPHNYRRRSVVYTGTHDNDTTLGWFHDQGGEASTRTFADTEKERVLAMRYLGVQDAHDLHWAMIRALYASVANLAIVPMQDILGLGTEARMNRPGLAHGNWGWTLPGGAITPALAARLRELVETYGRLRNESEAGDSPHLGAP